MSKPLSEELRDLAVDGEKLAAQMYTGPTTLRRWADRAAALKPRWRNCTPSAKPSQTGGTR